MSLGESNLLSSSSWRISEFWCPLGWAVLKTHVTADAARSLHRSRRHRRPALRLTSCLSRTGPGSREFLASTPRRWGVSCRSFGNHRFIPNLRSNADACRRHYIGTTSEHQNIGTHLDIVLLKRMLQAVWIKAIAMGHKARERTRHPTAVYKLISTVRSNA